MATKALLYREHEVAELVMDKALALIGRNGVVGGALTLEDPSADMPFAVRLFLDCRPEEVAGRLPKFLTLHLPEGGSVKLPVRPEYTGSFHG